MHGERLAGAEDGGMTHARHIQTAIPASSARGVAWAVLIGMGGTSVIYNVWHAVHGGYLNLFLALLYGIAPVFAAACLSHVVAEHHAGRFMKTAMVFVMLGAMALSIGAIADVVAPAAGPWMRWLFGAVLDAAALIALRVILDGRSRQGEAVAALEQAQSTAREAAGRTAQLEAELEAVRAEFGTVQAELEAEVQGLSSALNKARNKARSSGQKRRAASPPNTGVPADVDTQVEALRILGQHPDISGGELGRRLGKSERYGCVLRKRLAGHVADPGADARSEDR